jgi:hypothetical protein
MGELDQSPRRAENSMVSASAFRGFLNRLFGHRSAVVSCAQVAIATSFFRTELEKQGNGNR